ncbi:MAG: glutaredoxin family protein [Clostridia bacterium]|nr:glutaredoxin family protein [Clostridia bacterium]
MATKPFQVTIFSKTDCCLCDKAKAIVDKVALDYPLEVDVFDITTDAEVFAKYRYVIPVVAINGEEKFVSKVSELWLRRALGEMQAKI